MVSHRRPRERGKRPEAPLTASEYRSLRAINGQIQWAVRMIAYEFAFRASKLAGAMATPTVADLKEANKVVRSLRDLPRKPRLEFRAGVNARTSCLVAAHDVSFDNMPGHKSQRGLFVMAAAPELLDDHQHLHPCHL